MLNAREYDAMQAMFNDEERAQLERAANLLIEKADSCDNPEIEGHLRTLATDIWQAYQNEEPNYD